jgi:hypothetical protein
MPSGDITVVATDPAGNDSDPGKARLDTDAPKAPVVNDSNGSQLDGKGEPGDTITVKDPDGNPVPGCDDVLVGATGDWSCTPDSPLQPGDQVSVVETDPAGNESEPTEVTIGALSISVKYPQRRLGETQEVTGSNFNPGEKVCLAVFSQVLQAGCGTADQSGQVVISFEVPGSFEAGTHTVELTGEQSGKISTSFVVTAAPAVQTGGVVDQQVLNLRGLAVGAIVAGAGVLVVSKRRRAHRG